MNQYQANVFFYCLIQFKVCLSLTKAEYSLPLILSTVKNTFLKKCFKSLIFFVYLQQSCTALRYKCDNSLSTM